MTELHEQMVQLLPKLRRFARGLTGSPGDGDELVQTTCERALRKIDAFEPGTRMDSWLYRMAQNLWYDQLRAKKVRGNVVEFSTIDSRQLEQNDGEDMQTRHENQRQLARVEAAMRTLADDQRVVLMLVCVEGHSYQEAADLLQIPKGTVMSRLARARQQLQKILASQSTAADQRSR